MPNLIVRSQRTTDRDARHGRPDTSLRGEGFDARLGFVTERVEKDGYGRGPDRLDMVKST